MVTAIVILAFITFVLFTLCMVLFEYWDTAKRVGKMWESDFYRVFNERDAARHEANEYRADAADLQKKHDKERDLRKAAEERASRMAQALDTVTAENTALRTDLHLLSNKWK